MYGDLRVAFPLGVSLGTYRRVLVLRRPLLLFGSGTVLIDEVLVGVLISGWAARGLVRLLLLLAHHPGPDGLAVLDLLVLLLFGEELLPVLEVVGVNEQVWLLTHQAVSFGIKHFLSAVTVVIVVLASLHSLRLSFLARRHDERIARVLINIHMIDLLSIGVTLVLTVQRVGLLLEWEPLTPLTVVLLLLIVQVWRL